MDTKWAGEPKIVGGLQKRAGFYCVKLLAVSWEPLWLTKRATEPSGRSILASQLPCKKRTLTSCQE
jgi:hypothetical protein